MTRALQTYRHPREGGDPGHRPAGVRFLFALGLSVFLFAPAHAVEPGEMLKDPALEARARKISQELRCVVCQNQSIDDSNAPLAHDLRVLVRERLAAGDSRRPGAGLRRSPLRRVRAAAPALQAANASAVADAAPPARRRRPISLARAAPTSRDGLGPAALVCRRATAPRCAPPAGPAQPVTLLHA